jgi:hypothetical protein
MKALARSRQAGLAAPTAQARARWLGCAPAMKTSMTKTALLLTTTAAALLLAGCSNHRWSEVTSSRQSVKSSSTRKECKPSQYWDGETCRHKGQGKGARKHDD